MYYYASQGGRDCPHKHRTPDAARRCGERQGWDRYGSPALIVYDSEGNRA